MHGILIAIHTFNIGSINKLRVAYYKRMKKFLRAIVAFNITQMLVELRLSSFLILCVLVVRLLSITL